MDGSDGFCHKDSLNTQERIYRGGCAQWMRTGAGVMHEEFWETRPDRRTDIELFQLWVNLPASQKFDSPAVRYIGADDDTTTPPWIEEQQGGVRVRNVSRTLDFSLAETEHHNNRPPVEIQHVQIPPRTSWETSTIPRSHSAMVYVREGVATLEGGQTVAALQSASFSSNSGDTIRLDNSSKQTTLDVLLLSGQPLREPVALGGPIVMNTEQELYDAYQQLSDGTFLDRDVALRQQALSRRRMMHGNA